MFALGALVFVFAAIQSCFDPHDVWDRVQWVDPRDDPDMLARDAQDSVEVAS
jgi:hypothetical protein